MDWNADTHDNYFGRRKMHFYGHAWRKVSLWKEVLLELWPSAYVDCIYKANIMGYEAM